MNTKEKKTIQRQMVERYFRYKDFVDSFKFLGLFPVVSILLLHVVSVTTVSISTLGIDHAIDYSEVVEMFPYTILLVTGVGFLVTFFEWYFINLNGIEKQIRKAKHANEEQIFAYEQKISDKENPTKEDIKLQLKIRKLEIRQEELNFELELLDKAR